MVFPPQKPERRAVERDDEVVRQWLDRQWTRIKRLVRRRRAHLVFIDETGFLLAPLVRRTWAPVGQTPVLRQRTRHHRKVSGIGAITISPQRRRLGYYLHLHRDGSIGQEQVIAFLRDLLRHLRGDVVVVWDNLSAHRGRKVREYQARTPRLHLEYLPPYAPDLNPLEYSWSHTKMNGLANYCPANVDELHEAVTGATECIPDEQELLRGFLRATRLPIRL